MGDCRADGYNDSNDERCYLMEIFLVLLIFMVIGSVIALETNDLLASIISLGAVGLLSSVTFLFLGAPDITIVEVVVEVLVLVILIRATISRDLTTVSGDREFFGMVISIVLLGVIFIFGIRIFSDLPKFGEPVIGRFFDAPSNTYISQGLKETGASNIVNSILLDFRAYDTLGAVTVFFTAIMGALSILRISARKSSKEE